MELKPPTIRLRAKDTSRLIPSRYPPAGILDTICDPADLPAVTELEGWTNDRLSSELGIIMTIPAAEWVIGTPHATVVMAAYCHPRAEGGRFNTSDRGAWYAGLDLDTAIAETVFHRTRELEEIGVFEARMEMRQYLADFDGDFHDVRAAPAFDALHDPDDYGVSQALAADLLRRRSNGVLYRSVRRHGGECVACFRPGQVLNVRPAAHFEYRWQGKRTPDVIELARSA